MRRSLLVVVLGACNTHQLPTGPCAVEGVTGPLPGVTLAVRSDSCVYDQGTAARFTYEVTVDSTVPAVDIPDSGSSSCGPCDSPGGSDVLSWITWSIGGTSADGQTEGYCLCDTGCCPPQRAETIQPPPGTASDVIEWSGRTWTGPSDYGNPQGDAFAPGVYSVYVTFRGYDKGAVTAKLPIEID